MDDADKLTLALKEVEDFEKEDDFGNQLWHKKRVARFIVQRDNRLIEGLAKDGIKDALWQTTTEIAKKYFLAGARDMVERALKRCPLKKE